LEGENENKWEYRVKCQDGSFHMKRDTIWWLQSQADKLQSFVSELVSLVQGDLTSHKDSHDDEDKSGHKKVIRLSQFKSKKSFEEPKKVVGASFEPPKANDSRFEDI
jgi:hypothetical protein